MNYNKLHKLSTTQLGFRPSSRKPLTFIAGYLEQDELPDTIPFYIQAICSRLTRSQNVPVAFSQDVFRWPFDISKGDIQLEEGNYMSPVERPLYEGVLKRTKTPWGEFWLGDFDDFQEEGVFQIETQYEFSPPFFIDKSPYEKLNYGFFQFLNAQKSGVDVPGIRPMVNADDGVTIHSKKVVPVGGGWNDAGDERKWLAFTLKFLDSFSYILKDKQHPFYTEALEATKWGNDYFHFMINDEGQVYEDAGTGKSRDGEGYDMRWWNENHPGVTATSVPSSDNIPFSGDERAIRDDYNPYVQYAFITAQARIHRFLPQPYASRCLILAKRAYDYSQGNAGDERTLFLAAKIDAYLELWKSAPQLIAVDDIVKVVDQLLERQEQQNDGLKGFFKEENGDGFRSIVYSAEPAMSLMKVIEFLAEEVEEAILDRVSVAVKMYLEDYLMAGAVLNAFGVPPYGMYKEPIYPEIQAFHKTGSYWMRTFILAVHDRPMPHGTNSVLTYYAYAFAKAGQLFKNEAYIDASEKVLQWILGHNPFGKCMATDIGFDCPQPGSFYIHKVPFGIVAGCVGRLDDTPYLETSNAVEWSTQEIWSVPYLYVVAAVACIKEHSNAL